MFRVHYKANGEHGGSFMSAPMTREAAETKAAEMRQDVTLYDVEVKEA